MGTTFVLGKGGVGKTVISEGLAALSSESGHRTLLVRLGESLHSPDAPADKPGASRHGFDVVDLEARAAMDQYVRHVVRVRVLADRITGSEIYRKFFAAAPGLPELVVLGRIEAYARERDGQGALRWDTIVVDCPSAGHGLLMLETPFVAFRAASIGPFGKLASRITAWLREETRLAVVAIPEEMAVVEAIEFKDDLKEKTGLEISLAIVNRLRTETISSEARRTIAGDRSPAGSPDAWLVESGVRALRRNRLEAFHRKRLARGLDLSPWPVNELARVRPRDVAQALRIGA